MLDRVDEVLHLPRPKLPERTRLVCQYFKKHLHHDAPPMVFVNGGEHGPRRKREGGNTKFPSPEKELASNIPLCPETVNGDSPSATVGTMTNSNRLQSALATGICADSMSSTGSATKKCQETIDENNTDVCGDALAQKESATKNRSTKRKRWIERFTTWRKQYKVTRAGRSEPAASGWRGMKPVLLSEEFLEKKEILVRGFVSKSEGFYGRDIARFFLALQVGTSKSDHTVIFFSFFLIYDSSICCPDRSEMLP